MPPSIVRVTLVVDGAEHATEAEFEDVAGLKMMMRSLMVTVATGFLELMKKPKDKQGGEADGR